MSVLVAILFSIKEIQETANFSIILLSLFPVCFKFGSVLRKYRLKGIKHLYKEDIDNSVTLDLYIRELNVLTDLDYINYH